MPDAWETAHGLNPFENDALLDNDGDGVRNIDEFLGDTDPGTKKILSSGIVSNSAGMPMAGVQIEVISMTLRASFRAATDDDGFYSIVVVPAADYRVMAIAGDNYRPTLKNGGEIVYYNQTRDWRNAVELNLATGSKAGINFNFGMTAHAVNGTIAGIPDQRSVVVTAWDDSNGGWATAERAGNGPFQLDLPRSLLNRHFRGALW